VRGAEPLESVPEVVVGWAEVEPVDRHHPPPGLLLDPVETFVVGDPAPGPVVLVAVVLQEGVAVQRRDLVPGDKAFKDRIPCTAPVRTRRPLLAREIVIWGCLGGFASPYNAAAVRWEATDPGGPARQATIARCCQVSRAPATT
jgi:hypothetical protein